MQIKILADSINPYGNRLTTFLISDFPKCLLAELNTHRMFSRNAASSRAIPIEKMIEKVKADPFIPHFTRNQKGMQGVEDLQPHEIRIARDVWLKALDAAVEQVYELIAIGIHKQNANRLLEPFMKVPVIVSATEWENFFKLRTHPTAQPEFREYAVEMLRLRKEHQPIPLKLHEWHIPFADDDFCASLTIRQKLKVATARCARLSYSTHLGEYSYEADQKLHDSLLENGHLSPFEHCAVASYDELSKNFRGWRQYRSMTEIQGI
jgi:thymidylate synthase ThyX